ncbi:biotin--[acetyl-CoA-carboxylase] ligase [Erythrobacter sp. JK5]|uniref:biotin--[acetyl-CoA-carboxylase] ligase n=1 Tax=Erythrobacter sp. JK5 TaxID=2829500 RepID=UPI001BA62687|nr:biotin--[acetyl-CoA-carboxylase] ligase [Erythrobacter sp. JK5]QUL38640.1 biotin--[acetyl-CoA-carboxylase] ligase [Erythrobacter sp. JK5]
MSTRQKYIAETGSTNADLMAALRAHQKLEEGYWLISDRQTAGRGRQGRGWEDGAGNFMGSTIVTLQSGEYPGTWLNLPISLAVRETLAEFLGDASELMIKWPNDVLLRGAKVCGILMELFEFQVVIGIGVNLAIAPDIAGRKTIALAQVSEEPPSRDRFAARLIHHVGRELERWRTLGAEAMRVRWLGHAHPKGTPLAVHDGDGKVIEGVFEGITANGALLLEMPDGAIRQVHAGDVVLE